MLTAQEAFEKSKYVYLSGVLSKEQAQELTLHMWTLWGEKKLVKDDQCPQSYSIYGDAVLENVMHNLAAPLSKQLGIELIPTYTYARIYKTGEVLKKHRDRESCEISGTMTLGLDEQSAIWPIKFSELSNDEVGTQLEIDVGDMVMYRGNDLYHWRDKYKGNWQAQVFFHYVDANGPNKEFAHDKRVPVQQDKRVTIQPPKSSWLTDLIRQENITPLNNKIQETSPLPNTIVTQPPIEFRKDPIFNGVIIPSYSTECPGFTSFNKNFNPQMTFTRDECNSVINYAKKKYPVKATVGTDEKGTGAFRPEVRRVEQYSIGLNDETKWIFTKLTHAIAKANAEFYKFDITGITHELMLLHYKSDEQAFYDWHTDVGPGPSATRKISISAMMSDRTDYEGGELLVNNFGNVVEAPTDIGCLNMFPSYLLHTVKPVIKGERWVLVIWVHGSTPFR